MPRLIADVPFCERNTGGTSGGCGSVCAASLCHRLFSIAINPVSWTSAQSVLPAVPGVRPCASHGHKLACRIDMLIEHNSLVTNQNTNAIIGDHDTETDTLIQHNQPSSVAAGPKSQRPSHPTSTITPLQRCTCLCRSARLTQAGKEVGGALSCHRTTIPKMRPTRSPQSHLALRQGAKRRTPSLRGVAAHVAVPPRVGQGRHPTATQRHRSSP